MVESIETILDGDNLVEKLKQHLTDLEIAKIESMPPCSVSSALKLQSAIGIQRTKQVLKVASYFPEVDMNGRRRCVYKEDEIRCKTYSNMPTCDTHYDRATMISPSVFKNSSLRAAYTRNLVNPRKMQADSELAIMRTMLELLVAKAGENGNLPMEQIAAIASMSDKITVIVERMHKMNEITPEKIEIMMSKVVDIIAEYVHPDKLKECAEKIGNIGATLPHCEIPYLPGDSVQITDSNGNTTDTHVTTVTKRALIESAVMMGIENAGN